jgi:putative oxidoreductase
VHASRRSAADAAGAAQRIALLECAGSCGRVAAASARWSTPETNAGTSAPGWEDEMLSEGFLAPWMPRLLSVLRIVVGLLFIQHGTGKLFHVPHVPMFDTVDLTSLIGVAGVIEVIGGALFIIGLFTRPVAFVLSGLMAAAYFIGHAPRDPLPLLNNGELAITWCFTFLYFAAAGAGPWSVDATRRRA